MQCRSNRLGNLLDGEKEMNLILLDKKTANILEAVEIHIMENHGCYDIFPGMRRIDPMECDGYLVFHPEMGEFWIYMNKKWVDERFEVLGGL